MTETAIGGRPSAISKKDATASGQPTGAPENNGAPDQTQKALRTNLLRSMLIQRRFEER
jgi:hypothetical protein